MKLRFILPWAMLSFLVFAQQVQIKPQVQGEVVFVSGGVAVDERNELRAMRSEYNLHLMFTRLGTGEYLSDIKVVINDALGHKVMDVMAEGPMLFARIKSGRYAVSAERRGQLVNKVIDISDEQVGSLSFTWAS